jgi:uncharacterized protein (TIGR03437 family)
VVAAQGSAVTTKCQLKIGGVPAPVTFFGLVGGTNGFYQISVTFPFDAPGDQPNKLVMDGISNAQTW